MKNPKIFSEKSSDFVNFDGYIGKSLQNLSVYIQFLLKKKFEVDKKGFFQVKKYEMQVIVSMLTRSSERIFNLLRYIGCYYNLTA